MSGVVKSLLSASTDGRAVKVVATASAGTTIHTATAGTGSYDEIWLYAYNSDTQARLLTIQWGGTTAVDDDMKITIPSRFGWVPIVDGALLRNSLVVKAYAAAASVITIRGFVHVVTP